MKTMLLAIAVVLLGAVYAPAQTLPTAFTPPDVEVLEKSWRMYVRNPALEDDPFSANAEFTEAQRAQKRNDIQNAIRAKGSESREPPPPRGSKINRSPSKQFETYVYRAKIKNAGQKTIRVVDWEYIFVDPDTQQELGRHRYLTKVKIRSGQNSELVGRSATPQTSIVNVKSAGKEPSEYIIIYRVEYEDGSVWQIPVK